MERQKDSLPASVLLLKMYLGGLVVVFLADWWVMDLKIYLGGFVV